MFSVGVFFKWMVGNGYFTFVKIKKREKKKKKKIISCHGVGARGRVRWIETEKGQETSAGKNEEEKCQRRKDSELD